VDYCSLLDLARAGQAGAVEIGQATPSWNYCEASAKIGGRNITVLLGLLVNAFTDPRTTDLTRKLDHGLVAQVPVGATDGRCVRYLAFSDGASVEAHVVDGAAKTSDLSADAPTCAVVGAVFDGLVADVLAKKLRHFTTACPSQPSTVASGTAEKTGPTSTSTWATHSPPRRTPSADIPQWSRRKLPSTAGLPPR
jgi:hypothetical protein